VAFQAVDDTVLLVTGSQSFTQGVALSKGNTTLTVTYTYDTVPVPEPSTVIVQLLICAGGVGLFVVRRRRPCGHNPGTKPKNLRPLFRKRKGGFSFSGFYIRAPRRAGFLSPVRQPRDPGRGVSVLVVGAHRRRRPTFLDNIRQPDWG